MPDDKPAYFLDTNIFVSFYNLADRNHQKARQILEKLEKEEAKLITSNFVLSEVYTVLAQKAGKKKAVEFGELVQKENAFFINRVGQALEKKAWEIFKKVKSKNLSYVDATILAILSKNPQLLLLTLDQQLKRLSRWKF